MTAPERPVPYQVVVSGFVRQRIQELSDQATARGDGPAFVAAVKAFLARVAIYPEFGDPIIDLIQGNGQVRVGIIRPLSMRYGVREDLRVVYCDAPPMARPGDSVGE